MKESVRDICEVGYCSRPVHTDTFIRLNWMGPEGFRAFEVVRPLPWRLSNELDQLSTAISIVEKTIGVPYASEPYSTRRRYILVAAIVTTILLDIWRICVVDRRNGLIT